MVLQPEYRGSTGYGADFLAAIYQHFGDRAYEVGAFIRNPMPELAGRTDLEELLQRRVSTMAKYLGFDSQRVWGWSYSQAVLAAVWSIEDKSDDWLSWIGIARALGSPNR